MGTLFHQYTPRSHGIHEVVRRCDSQQLPFDYFGWIINGRALDLMVFWKIPIIKCKRKKKGRKKNYPRDVEALMKLHRSDFIDSVPERSWKARQPEWREKAGESTKQLSKEVMIPTIAQREEDPSGGGEGCTRQHRESIWHWFIFVKKEKCRLRGFVRFPSVHTYTCSSVGWIAFIGTCQVPAPISNSPLCAARKNSLHATK